MRTLLLTALLSVSACALAGGDRTRLAEPLKKGQAEAVFAGGCFWCIEKDFEKLPGVFDAQSGYTGGSIEGPTYHQVGTGITGHIESIRVIYDPKKVTYQELVHYFFRHVDPTQADGQFCDRGHQYTTAVFVHDEAERKVALAEKASAQEVLGATVVTPIQDAGKFWLAEEYHQDFYEKNPEHYARYRKGCGRDARVQQLWGAEGH